MKKVIVLLMVAMCFTLTTFSQVTNRSNEAPKRHLNANMPSFRGGDIEDFRVYIQKTVKYSEEAVKEAVTGTVYVGFVINRRGKITDVKIVRSVEERLDNAVVKAVTESPDWKHNGHRRSVNFTIPVNFILK